MSAPSSTPLAVKAGVLLYALVLFYSAATVVFSYLHYHPRFPALGLPNRSGTLTGVDTVVLIAAPFVMAVLFAWGLPAVLLFRVTSARRWARTALAIYTALAVAFALVTAPFLPSSGSATHRLTAWYPTIVEIIAVALLFVRSSSDWFLSGAGW
jgi:hypothetical protein